MGCIYIEMEKSMGKGWALTINIEKVIVNVGHRQSVLIELLMSNY